jgi:hypothetical protein
MVLCREILLHDNDLMPFYGFDKSDSNTTKSGQDSVVLMTPKLPSRFLDYNWYII